MSIKHEFQVISKTVDFSEEYVNPLKLFTVTGDVLAHVVPIIKNGFSTENATLNVGEQGKPSILYMDSKYDPRKEPLRPVSSDLYLTVTEEEGDEITSGVVVYYCIFAKLSADGEVEEVE